MNFAMKKWVGLFAVAVLASSLIALAGCASSSGSSGASSTASTDASAAGQSASVESASSETASSASAELANPWSNAATAEEAAKGAGLDAFALPEGAIADMGEPFEITYRYMDGMAEARYEFPAAALTVRTATIATDESSDISGDYNVYAHEWTEYIDNIPVACAGNREGESIKTYWGDEGAAHSIVAEGLGGDQDFGLAADRLAVFVEAMQ